MKQIIVKDLRKALRLTQEEFAKKLEVNVATVSRWERGIKNPRPIYQRKMDRMFKNAVKKVNVGVDIDNNSDMEG